MKKQGTLPHGPRQDFLMDTSRVLSPLSCNGNSLRERNANSSDELGCPECGARPNVGVPVVGSAESGAGQRRWQQTWPGSHLTSEDTQESRPTAQPESSSAARSTGSLTEQHSGRGQACQAVAVMAATQRRCHPSSLCFSLMLFNKAPSPQS